MKHDPFDFTLQTLIGISGFTGMLVEVQEKVLQRIHERSEAMVGEMLLDQEEVDIVASHQASDRQRQIGQDL